MTTVWKKSMVKAGVKDAVNKTISSTLMSGYKASKKSPEDFFKVGQRLMIGHFYLGLSWECNPHTARTCAPSRLYFYLNERYIFPKKSRINS